MTRTFWDGTKKESINSEGRLGEISSLMIRRKYGTVIGLYNLEACLEDWAGVTKTRALSNLTNRVAVSTHDYQITEFSPDDSGLGRRIGDFSK